MGFGLNLMVEREKSGILLHEVSLAFMEEEKLNCKGIGDVVIASNQRRLMRMLYSMYFGSNQR